MEVFIGYRKITILLIPLFLLFMSFDVEAKTLTSIAVTPSNFTIAISETIQFSATAYYSDGTTGDISNSATWTSGNTSYATASSSGLVEGIAAGTSTIRADSSGVEGVAAISVAASVTETDYDVIKNSHFGASSAPSVSQNKEVWSDFVDLGVHYMRMPVDVPKGALINSGFLNQYDSYVTTGQNYGLIMDGIVNPRPVNGQYDTSANFASVLQTLVERYDGEGSSNMSGLLYPVKNWEVCNEITYGVKCDASCYWSGFTETNYLDFMSQSRTALKAACSDCNLLNGSQIGPPSL
ncbi:MAG: Ig-like domain-containing protein, partial [Nitrospirae bacterium]|nr:Ig-like domain-containing protein [Nitrospirota bacterium]